MVFCNDYVNSCNSTLPQLFNNSPLKNLELNNLALYPQSYDVSPSCGSLQWANVNFQDSGVAH